MPAMKEKASRPIRSLTSQILWFCLASTLLAGDMGLIFTIRENLSSGKTYSPLVVWGDNHLVYESVSPEAFVTFMGLYILSAIAMFAAVIQQLFEIAAEQKRKNEATALQGESSLKNNIILVGSALTYLAFLLWISLVFRESLAIK
jgi:hypothetical protein